MTDIKFIDDNTIRFQKMLWHQSEVTLAKCLGFSHDPDTGVIECNVPTTAMRAIENFIRVGFKNFNESVVEAARKEQFFGRLNAIKDALNTHANGIIHQRLPYFDKLYQHQRDVLYEAFYKRVNYLALDMGLGKAQAYDSPVLTPNGFVPMRDIKPGSLVIGANGNHTRVISVHPQREMQYYNITFTDGSIVETCGEHLWSVQTPVQKKRGKGFITKSVNDLIFDLFQSKRKNTKWFIPIVKPVWFYSKETNLNPYLLGAILGDGGITQKSFSFTNSDDEIIDFIRNFLPENTSIIQKDEINYAFRLKNPKGRHTLKEALKKYGLLGKSSSEKFIPSDYKYNCIDTRIEILRGLLDTDGYCSKVDGTIQFYSTSERLADDVTEIVRSLGGIAKKTSKKGAYKKNGVKIDCKVCFIITINLPQEIIPFRLKRKVDLLKKFKKYNPYRGIVKIEPSRITNGQCIRVEAKDHLYVMDQYAVTHNTLTSASLSRIHKIQRTVIMCPSAVKYNWWRDLKKFGYNELYFTILDAKRKRTIEAFDERFVIVNYDVIENFFDVITKAPIGHFIFDEAHNLKNHLSKRSKMVKEIVDLYPDARITFLSGTPITNRVNDAYNYLRLIGHELGNNHTKFLEEYTVRTNGRGGERVTGGRNLDDLRIKMSNFMIRKRKEDCIDLPEKIFHQYFYEMDDYREEYNKVLEELAKQKDIKVLTGNIHSLNIIVARAKIKGIIEIANSIIEEGRKVVIFSSYKDPLKELEKHFGSSCTRVDGSVDSFQRDQNVQRFIEDPECMVFLGNDVAAGVGINLVNSSDVIFVNFPLIPGKLYQCIDRCHRIGQGRSVNVHYTFCQESIDEYLYELILDKEMDINAVIDEGKEVILREDMVTVLVKKLLKRDNIEINNEVPVSEMVGSQEKKEVEISKLETETGSMSSEVRDMPGDKPKLRQSTLITSEQIDKNFDHIRVAREKIDTSIFKIDSSKQIPSEDPRQYHLMCHTESDCLFIVNHRQFQQDPYGDGFVHVVESSIDIQKLIDIGREEARKHNFSFNEEYVKNDEVLVNSQPGRLSPPPSFG